MIGTLVELLVELKTLVASSDKNKLDKVNKLFSNPKAPAEYQVGRHFVASKLEKDVEVQISDLDPRQRKAAVQTVMLAFPRSSAAKLLRRVAKDPDMTVRSAARHTIKTLALNDVAPPDIRYAPDMGVIGHGNPTGWAFGIFAHDWRSDRKPKKPSKVTALDAHKLPKLKSVADVAALVGIELDDLPALMRPGVGPGSGYVEFEIPKAKGGTRRIAAPRAPLRKVQRAILDQIVGKVPVHEACHGFVKTRSTVTNAAPHQGSAIVVKLDLKDFFPTVHYRRVRGLFEFLGYNAEVANVLAGLTTYRPKLDDGTILWPGVLPQGAPTSPAIANLACRRLDHRLDRLAAKYDATYTRYADDLTFSFKTSDLKLGRFLWWVDGICQQEGFNERPDKRRVLRSKHQQRVTGIVVNAGVHVPRVDKRQFRAMLHNCKKHGLESQARGKEDFEAYLRGYAAYVNMVDPPLGKKFIAQVEAVLGGTPGG
ncbi:MAG: RNA-directed DNA polymerase [Deltaproteobacteria bacterium]|nr:RNA-directed DNA polymerase [Deltaproteobacteria bacterium]